MKLAGPILQALAEPVLVLDGSLRAVMANPAFYETLKIAPGELEGKSIQELIASESGVLSLGAVLKAVAAYDSDIDNLEVECALIPNVRSILCVHARRINITETGTELVLVELRDVTREKSAERRIRELSDAFQRHNATLEKTNEELDSFTHSVSHDLRTPLRLTNKIAHLLLHEHGVQLPVSAKEKIQMILDSTEEMGELIEDLLTFSQVNREPMKRRAVDPKRLVRESLDTLRDEQKGRSVEVTVEDLPPCKADRALMKQVFLNLLANALKFTRPRKVAEIHVGYTQTIEETIYFIRDNGIGFDMGHAESIFVVFHRLHKAHDFEGSGVGLALVKRIIERHNGRIWAEGAPDRGATIYFTVGE